MPCHFVHDGLLRNYQSPYHQMHLSSSNFTKSIFTQGLGELTTLFTNPLIGWERGPSVVECIWLIQPYRLTLHCSLHHFACKSILAHCTQVAVYTPGQSLWTFTMCQNCLTGGDQTSGGGTLFNNHTVSWPCGPRFSASDLRPKFPLPWSMVLPSHYFTQLDNDVNTNWQTRDRLSQDIYSYSHHRIHWSNVARDINKSKSIWNDA